MFLKFAELIEYESNNLRELAKIAGGDPRNFYEGADFFDVDISGQDLTGMSFKGTSFVGATFDDSTRIDSEFDEHIRKQVSFSVEDSNSFQSLHNRAFEFSGRFRRDELTQLMGELILDMILSNREPSLMKKDWDAIFQEFHSSNFDGRERYKFDVRDTVRNKISLVRAKYDNIRHLSSEEIISLLFNIICGHSKISEMITTQVRNAGEKTISDDQGAF